MKVQLIHPSTGGYSSNSRSGSYPPLGLISIATHLQHECPHVEVEILDGEKIPDHAIINRLNADIVGINANTVTYPQALRIAEAAKELGSNVILGGVYPTAIPDVILSKRSHIFDSIIVGYGERPMEQIVRGKREKIMVNREPEFTDLPYPDRSLIDLDRYILTFQQKHPTWRYRSTSIFTNVGCGWRERSGGGCIFCSRSGEKTAKKTPRAIWDEIRDLVEKHGINHIVDFSDTLLQDTDLLTALVKCKPRDLDPIWYIFGRIDEVTVETLRLMKRLRCDHLFVGIESGDSEMYRNARKGGGSPGNALDMARSLREYDIALTPCYVTGLPGETKQSLERTHDHARRLYEISGFEEVFCCPLIPYPGSIAFESLKTKIGLDGDLFDTDDLKRLWTEKFCHVSFDTLMEYTERVLELGTYRITVGNTASCGA